jgi:hypothetical protein
VRVLVVLPSVIDLVMRQHQLAKYPLRQSSEIVSALDEGTITALVYTAQRRHGQD